MEDDKELVFICEECDEIFENIFDYAVHKDSDVPVLASIGDGVVLNFWPIIEDLYFMLEDDNDTERVKEVLQALGATIYAAANGVLRKELEETLVQSFVENLDDTLKELLDEQADNDN
jgi:DNA-binding FrmR family transcriptional regulator